MNQFTVRPDAVRAPARRAAIWHGRLLRALCGCCSPDSSFLRPHFFDRASRGECWYGTSACSLLPSSTGHGCLRHGRLRPHANGLAYPRSVARCKSNSPSPNTAAASFTALCSTICLRHFWMSRSTIDSPPIRKRLRPCDIASSRRSAAITRQAGSTCATVRPSASRSAGL